MSEKLRNGWKKSLLQDLVSKAGIFCDGDWIESKDQDINGKIRLIQLADIGDGVFLNKSHRFINEEQFRRLNCTEILPNDILIARMPDPLGRNCIFPSLPNRAVTVVDVAIVRPASNDIDVRWLSYVLNAPNIRQRIELLSSGTTRKRITRKKLGEIELLVPNLAEQAAIANKLDSLLARTKAIRLRLEPIFLVLKRFRQSVLDAALTGRLTEAWRASNKVSMDETWSSSTLGELSIEMRNGLSPKPEESPPGFPILRISSVRPFSVSFEGVRYLKDCKKELLQQFKIQVGDLLFTRYNGSIDYLGVCALVRSVPFDSVYPDKLIRVRVDSNVIRPAFLEISANSPQARDFITSLAKTTAGQKGISGKDLKSLSVPLPSSEEQDEIIIQVEKLFSLANNLEQKLNSALRTLSQCEIALLEKACRGELIDEGQNSTGGNLPSTKVLAASNLSS